MADLQRFIDAQAGRYEQALAEIRAGKKRGHWMWFMFPQLRGLGRSAMAQTYGIADLGEARAFLQAPLLAARLQSLTAAVLAHKQLSAESIFGAIDALKLRSSMTLFSLAAADAAQPFAALLAQKFAALPCPLTLDKLGLSSSDFSSLHSSPLHSSP